MKYRMEDGTVIDTARATQHWDNRRDWDGRNQIHRPTGSQWAWQTLYRSRKGRYYIEHGSGYQGTRPHVEWVSNEEATRWLLHNDHELPNDLEALADEVSE